MSGPAAFLDVEAAGAQVRVREEAEGWARSVLESGETLHERAARHPDALVLQGRGRTYAIPAPGARGGDGEQARWVVRHYRRGGWMAPVLGDRYLAVGTRRPLAEVEASEKARTRGVRTPRVLAAAVYSGRVFYRGDLVSEFVPNTRDLAEVLFGGERTGLSGSVDRREALAAAGELIRKMARAGVRHPDLNAKNVLLQWSGAAPTPWLVDLDRVTVRDGGDPGLARAMHRRLVRSLRKWEKKSGTNLSEAYFGVLTDSVERPW